MKKQTLLKQTQDKTLCCGCLLVLVAGIGSIIIGILKVSAITLLVLAALVIIVSAIYYGVMFVFVQRVRAAKDPSLKRERLKRLSWWLRRGSAVNDPMYAERRASKTKRRRQKEEMRKRDEENEAMLKEFKKNPHFYNTEDKQDPSEDKGEDEKTQK